MPSERSHRDRVGARHRRSSVWEPAELAAFLKSVKDTRLEAAWRLAAMTGMRRGEVLGLRWCDVDLGASRVAVRNAVVSVAYEVTALAGFGLHQPE